MCFYMSIRRNCSCIHVRLNYNRCLQRAAANWHFFGKQKRPKRIGQRTNHVVSKRIKVRICQSTSAPASLCFYFYNNLVLVLDFQVSNPGVKGSLEQERKDEVKLFENRENTHNKKISWKMKCVLLHHIDQWYLILNSGAGIKGGSWGMWEGTEGREGRDGRVVGRNKGWRTEEFYGVLFLFSVYNTYSPAKLISWNRSLHFLITDMQMFAFSTLKSNSAFDLNLSKGSSFVFFIADRYGWLIAPPHECIPL